MIFKLAKNKRSLLAIGFIFLSTVLINFSHHRWQQEDKIIEWDIKSYYAYLPATFIYQDLSLDFIHDESGKFKDLIWPIETPLKRKAIITTMGMSILYAPFFGMAHVYAKASDYEADGYSMPYRFALVFSALFYVLLVLEPICSIIRLMRLLCHTLLISRSSPYLCISLFNFIKIRVMEK